jgi:hypothetical protein
MRLRLFWGKLTAGVPMFNKSHPSIEQAFQLFAEVGKAAVLQELKVRLLASKTNEIKDSAHEYKVVKTEEAVVSHFLAKSMICDEEKDLIEKARQIRNKILHCEFDEAIKRIEELIGAALPGPSVLAVKFENDSDGAAILRKLASSQAAKAEGPKNYVTTVDQLIPEEAGMFGLFLNAVQKGAFNAALEIFKKSNGIIERLITETAKPSFKPSR